MSKKLKKIVKTVACNGGGETCDLDCKFCLTVSVGIEKGKIVSRVNRLLQVVVYFQHFLCKKALKKREKVTNLHQNLAKNVFFKFAPKRWTRVLFSTLTLKMTISSAGYVL